MRRLARDNLKRDTRLVIPVSPLICYALSPEGQTAIDPSGLFHSGFERRESLCPPLPLPWAVCVLGGGWRRNIWVSLLKVTGPVLQLVFQLDSGWILATPSFSLPFKSGEAMTLSCRVFFLFPHPHIHGPWFIACFLLLK